MIFVTNVLLPLFWIKKTRSVHKDLQSKRNKIQILMVRQVYDSEVSRCFRVIYIYIV